MVAAGTSKALQVALDYHRAWTGGDFEQAMTLVASDIRCDAPAGTLQGAEAFRAFMGPFAQQVRRTELLGAFGDDEAALLMYDTETPLVDHAPGAEWHTVTGGKIVRMRIIFDRLPFEEARRQQQA